MGIMEWMNNNMKVAEEKAARDVATWSDEKLRKCYEGYATGDDRIDYSPTYDNAIENEMKNRGFIS